MRDILLTNSSLLIKQLNQIEPGVKKSLMRESKRLAMDIVKPIKQSIPKVAPLSGFNDSGKFNWANQTSKKGRGRGPLVVKPVFKSSLSRKYNVSSLVRVATYGPAVVMTDMARNGRKPSGRAMIRNLGGSASRYVWPAAEKALPQVTADVKSILDQTTERLGRKLF